MPNPNNYNSKNKFMSDCMSEVDDEEDKKDWTHDRKLAHCLGIWRNRKASSKQERIAVAIEKIARAVKDE